MGLSRGNVPINVSMGRGAELGRGLLGVLAGVWAFVLFVLFTVAIDWDTLDNGARWGLILLLIVLPFGLLYGAGRMIKAWAKTWLEGVVLVRRGILATKRTDLASAPDVYADSRPEVYTYSGGKRPTGRQLPYLVILDPGAKRWVILPLTGRGGAVLPPGQLLALADAIAAGERPDPYGERATNTVNWLRRLANDPSARML